MKTVATFSKPYEAHLLISRLEGSGIAAFARDENMVTLDWLASNAIGGVKVDVADEDYDRAVAAIAATATSEEKELAASSRQRVTEFESGFRKTVLRFALGAIPLGLIAFVVTPAPKFKDTLMVYERQPPDMRPLAAAVAALSGGLFASVFLGQKKTPNQAPEPMPLKRHGSS